MLEGVVVVDKEVAAVGKGEEVDKVLQCEHAISVLNAQNKIVLLHIRQTTF